MEFKMASMLGILSLVFFISTQTVDGKGYPFLTCLVTPPVRDLKSLKPVEILAVRGEEEFAVTMTFSGRDDGVEIYSNGDIAEYGEIEGRRDVADGKDLQIQYVRLHKPEEEYLEPGRFGVHYCDLFYFTRQQRATVLIHNQQTLIPRDGIRTHVVSTGDTLKLCVDSNLPKSWKGPIEWAFNGKQPSWLKRFSGSTCIKIKNVQTCQAGVYEAYRRICGRREKQHAFFEVKVRRCPDGYQGVTCVDTCPVCSNGYCGDLGGCVCANGFAGSTCGTAMSGIFGNVHDVTYESVDLDPLGKGSLICTEEAGCSCPPGWKGIGCDQECDDLSYGPDCAYSCPGGVACNAFTGQAEAS